MLRAMVTQSWLFIDRYWCVNLCKKVLTRNLFATNEPGAQLGYLSVYLIKLSQSGFTFHIFPDNSKERSVKHKPLYDLAGEVGHWDPLAVFSYPDLSVAFISCLGSEPWQFVTLGLAGSGEHREQPSSPFLSLASWAGHDPALNSSLLRLGCNCMFRAITSCIFKAYW